MSRRSLALRATRYPRTPHAHIVSWSPTHRVASIHPVPAAVCLSVGRRVRALAAAHSKLRARPLRLRGPSLPIRRFPSSEQGIMQAVLRSLLVLGV